MSSTARRCVALFLVDRTLTLRQLDDRFRWRRSVVAVLLLAVSAGIALAIVLTGVVHALLPALANRAGMLPAELLGITITLALLTVATAVASLSGQEIRVAVHPFDAGILAAAGFQRSEVVAVRLGLPALSSAGLTLWAGLTLIVPLADAYPAGTFPVAVGCFVAAVVVSLLIKLLGVVVLSERRLASLRGVLWRCVGALVGGMAVPPTLRMLEGRGINVLDIARETVQDLGTARYVHLVLVAEAVAVGVLGILVGLGARRRRAPERLRTRRRSLVGVRAPWQFVVFSPFQRLVRSSRGDALDARLMLTWASYGASFVVGLHLGGGPGPLESAPGTTTTAAAVALAYVVYATCHPYASLLSHRAARNALYASAAPQWLMSSWIMWSGMLAALPLLVVVWAGLAWLSPGRGPGVELIVGLVLAVAVHFVADATLSETRNVAHHRIEQTLPQRLLSSVLFATGAAGLVALDQVVRAHAGAALAALAALLTAVLVAVSVAALVQPRPWGTT